MGQWKFPGQITKIPSGNITMQGVPYPVLGKDNLGNEIMMQTDKNYQFPGTSVTEYPQFQKGGDYNMLGYAMHHPIGALKHFINPEKYHATDEYKKPNHITFSDESKYSNQEHKGGHWEKQNNGTWTFTPSSWNIKNAEGYDKLQDWWSQNESKSGNILLPPSDDPQIKLGGWLNSYEEEYKKGGQKGLRKFTSKNIQTSLNDIMRRNTTLFGSSGKKRYKPDLNYKYGGWLEQYQDGSQTKANPLLIQAFQQSLIDQKINEQKAIDAKNQEIKNNPLGIKTLTTARDNTNVVPIRQQTTLSNIEADKKRNEADRLLKQQKKTQGTLRETPKEINPNEAWRLAASNYQGHDKEEMNRIINSSKTVEGLGALAGVTGGGLHALASIPAVANTLGLGFAAHGVHSLPSTYRTLVDPNESVYNKARALTYNTADFLGMKQAAEALKGIGIAGKWAYNNAARSVASSPSVVSSIDNVAINLESQIANLKQQEVLAEKSRKALWADYKAGKISGEDYTIGAKKLNPGLEGTNPRFELEKQLRQHNVKQDIINTPQQNILKSENQLGKNISDGGTNNKGVFELGDDYVARLSAHGYDDASRLVNYADKIKSPRIAKTLQVKEIDGKVYQVQNKVTGTPIPKLSETELQNIPKEHIDNFWKDKAELDNLGLSIDISGGKSNIFYDPKKGFQFIDLGIGESSTNEVIAQTYKGLKLPGSSNKFKSEIDWGKWNKEITENKALMKEYDAIESTSKANGTWMKNTDGSPFQGTPEQFVQQNSENFKKAFPEGTTTGYRGAHQNIDDFANRNRNDYATFLTDNKKNAESYATSDGLSKNYYHPDIDVSNEWKDGVYQLGFQQNAPKVIGEAGGRKWRLLDYDENIAKNIGNNAKQHNEFLKENQFRNTYQDVETASQYDPSKNYLSTDNYATYVKGNKEAVAQINNVKDQMGFATNVPTNTVYAIDANRVPLKSLRYNNGMFDMTNPNIYKSLLPVGLGTAAALSQEKKLGGQKSGWLDQYQGGGGPIKYETILGDDGKPMLNIQPEVEIIDNKYKSPLLIGTKGSFINSNGSDNVWDKVKQQWVAPPKYPGLQPQLTESKSKIPTRVEEIPSKRIIAPLTEIHKPIAESTGVPIRNAATINQSIDAAELSKLAPFIAAEKRNQEATAVARYRNEQARVNGTSTGLYDEANEVRKYLYQQDKKKADEDRTAVMMAGLALAPAALYIAGVPAVSTALAVGSTMHGINAIPNTYRNWVAAADPNNETTWEDALGTTALNALDFWGTGQAFKQGNRVYNKGLNKFIESNSFVNQLKEPPISVYDRLLELKNVKPKVQPLTQFQKEQTVLKTENDFDNWFNENQNNMIYEQFAKSAYHDVNNADIYIDRALRNKYGPTHTLSSLDDRINRNPEFRLEALTKGYNAIRAQSNNFENWLTTSQRLKKDLREALNRPQTSFNSDKEKQLEISNLNEIKDVDKQSIDKVKKYMERPVEFTGTQGYSTKAILGPVHKIKNISSIPKTEDILDLIESFEKVYKKVKGQNTPIEQSLRIQLEDLTGTHWLRTTAKKELQDLGLNPKDLSVIDNGTGGSKNLVDPEGNIVGTVNLYGEESNFIHSTGVNHKFHGYKLKSENDKKIAEEKLIERLAKDKAIEEATTSHYNRHDPYNPHFEFSQGIYDELTSPTYFYLQKPEAEKKLMQLIDNNQNFYGDMLYRGVHHAIGLTRGPLSSNASFINTKLPDPITNENIEAMRGAIHWGKGIGRGTYEQGPDGILRVIKKLGGEKWLNHNRSSKFVNSQNSNWLNKYQ